MKVQYVSSACVLVEHGGTRVLCDPWLTDGIYYGSWYHYPLLPAGPEAFLDVDYLFISHIHPDHCDIESLKAFPKNIPILIHNYEEKFMLKLLKHLGFDNITEVSHKAPVILSSDLTLEILAADNCDPTLCGRWFNCHVHGNPTHTLQIDSLAVFSGGGKVVVNTNDCPFPMSKVVCDYIMEKYKAIDFLLCGYSGAGPYPQCFKALSMEEKLEKARIKKYQFLNQAVSYLSVLKPRYFLPFAGQYTLGGKLNVLNHLRGIPELEELDDLFRNLLRESNISSKMVLLNGLEYFDVDNEQPSAPFIPTNPKDRQRYVYEVLSKKKYIYECSTEPLDKNELFQLLEQAYQHMKSKLIFYGFSTHTNVYLNIGDDHLFSIPFTHYGEVTVTNEENMKEPFVEIELHPRLLEMILKRKAHWNNAEIGSHLVYNRVPDVFERGLYHFLSYLN